MVRTVVTILVAVPLLMPPGMCLCQFAPAGHVFATTWAEATRQEHAAHTPGSRPDCRCDSCRERAVGPDLPAGSQGRPSPDGPPPSGPGKHPPGCPAALGDMPTKVSAPAVTIPFDANPGPCFDSLVAGPTAPVRGAREGVSAQAASPPLFISHCSLLI